MGHVGLVESAALCALGLGLDVDEYEEEIAPVIAEEDIPGGAFVVPRGRVAGVNQTVVGLEDGQERVRLELMLALGAEPPGDRIVIESDTRLTVDIPGGIPGDSRHRAARGTRRPTRRLRGVRACSPCSTSRGTLIQKRT